MAQDLLTDEEVHERLMKAHQDFARMFTRTRFAASTVQSASAALYALAAALLIKMDERNDEVEAWRERQPRDDDQA